MSDVAGRIHLALVEIRDHYDDSLQPVRRAAGSHVQTTQVAPLPVSGTVLDARQECRRRLAGIVRKVIEGRDLHTEHVAFFDVAGMVEMLIRHLDWIGRHEMADVFLQHLRSSAHDLTAIAAPQRREWLFLGMCPLVIEHDDEFVLTPGGDLVKVEVPPTPCTGSIRGYPDSDPYCDVCEVQAVVGWWERQMWPDPELHNILTAPELRRAIRRELGRDISEITIRSYVHRGLFRIFDKDLEGRNLYHRVDVICSLADHWQRSAS